MGDVNMMEYLSKQVENKQKMVVEYQEMIIMKNRVIENLVQENALLKQKYGVK